MLIYVPTNLEAFPSSKETAFIVLCTIMQYWLTCLKYGQSSTYITSTRPVSAHAWDWMAAMGSSIALLMLPSPGLYNFARCLSDLSRDKYQSWRTTAACFCSWSRRHENDGDMITFGCWSSTGYVLQDRTLRCQPPAVSGSDQIYSSMARCIQDMDVNTTDWPKMSCFCSLRNTIFCQSCTIIL